MVEFRDNDDDTVVLWSPKGRVHGRNGDSWAVGFLPNTDLLAGKVDMLPNGAIVVDDSHAGVRAACTCRRPATVFYNPTGQHDTFRWPPTRCARPSLVAANIETPTVKYMGTQATSAVQLYDLSLAASGLTRAGAERRGLTVRETSLTEDYRPDLMLTTTTPVTSILTWDPETRKGQGRPVLFQGRYSRRGKT